MEPKGTSAKVTQSVLYLGRYDRDPPLTGLSLILTIRLV